MMRRLWIAVCLWIMLAGGALHTHAQSEMVTWYFAVNPDFATFYAFNGAGDMETLRLQGVDSVTVLEAWRLGPERGLLAYDNGNGLLQLALMTPNAITPVPDIGADDIAIDDLRFVGAGGSMVAFTTEASAWVIDTDTGASLDVSDMAAAYVGEHPLVRVTPTGMVRYVTAAGALVEVNPADGSRTTVVDWGAVPTYATASRDGAYWLVQVVGDEFAVSQTLIGPDGATLDLPNPDATYEIHENTLIGYYLDEPLIYVGRPSEPLTAITTPQPIYNLTRFFAGDGRLTLVVGNNLWFFGDGQAIDLGPLHFGLYSLETSPDARWAITADANPATTYRVWDLTNGVMLAEEPMPAAGAIYAHYGEAGVVVADWGYSEMVRLYSAAGAFDLPLGGTLEAVVSDSQVVMGRSDGLLLIDLDPFGITPLVDDPNVRVVLR